MRSVLSGILIFSLCFGLSGADSKLVNENIQKQPIVKVVNVSKNTQNSVKIPDKLEVKDIKITVGKDSFNAKLYQNKTTKAFIDQLPMTIEMSELNRNEKYYYLSNKLSTSSEKVGEIHAGDIMLYGSNCLVLFYEDISTSYAYTRIGSIEDAIGLAQAVGDKNCKVTFDLAKNIKFEENKNE